MDRSKNARNAEASPRFGPSKAVASLNARAASATASHAWSAESARRLAASAASSTTPQVVLCPIAGVDPNVAFGEIAGPETRASLSRPANRDADLALAGVQFRLQVRLSKTAPPGRRGTPARPACAMSVFAGSNATPALPAAERMRPQLGSEPAMAVFTSGELAMARAMRAAASSDGAPRYVDGDELARAFAVARDGLRQRSPSRRRWPLRQLAELLGIGPHAGGAVGQQHQRVVGGGVAIHREAVVAALHAALQHGAQAAPAGMSASVITKPSVVAMCG